MKTPIILEEKVFRAEVTTKNGKEVPKEYQDKIKWNLSNLDAMLRDLKSGRYKLEQSELTVTALNEEIEGLKMQLSEKNEEIEDAYSITSANVNQYFYGGMLLGGIIVLLLIGIFA